MGIRMGVRRVLGWASMVLWVQGVGTLGGGHQGKGTHGSVSTGWVALRG